MSSAIGGQGGALQGPWGDRCGAGGRTPRPVGELLGDLLRAPKKSEAQSEDAWRVCGHLGVLGPPAGAQGAGMGALLIIDPDQQPSGSGPWPPPLSYYKLKFIAQRKIGRSEICPPLRWSNTLLGRWHSECVHI